MSVDIARLEYHLQRFISRRMVLVVAARLPAEGHLFESVDLRCLFGGDEGGRSLPHGGKLANEGFIAELRLIEIGF